MPQKGSVEPLCQVMSTDPGLDLAPAQPLAKKLQFLSKFVARVDIE